MESRVQRNISKNVDMQHNVTIRVIDPIRNKILSTHIGHNMATNSMLTGIAHYLTGDGVFNQAGDTLIRYVPQFISLGTMGLYNQNEKSNGTPSGIGRSSEATAEENYTWYMSTIPGYGADGYDAGDNNNRAYLGLGMPYAQKVQITQNTDPVNCELISTSCQRARISYREIVPETSAEFPHTMDVILSAMISTGNLSQFRHMQGVEDSEVDHIFITEAGLWSSQSYIGSGNENGLLAAYRIVPPNSDNWDMSLPTNRDLLDSQIIRVGKNQVVQVVWKIQIGSLEDRNESGGGQVDQNLYWWHIEPDSTNDPLAQWNSIGE